MNFEQTLKELEEIAAKLEHGDLALEEALSLYVHGVEALQACQALLAEAEQKVELLVKETRKPFSPQAPI
ncbi:MAG: Exodeoxyribonuclease 7 small subunit [Firmicutes bacterium]|nr:Exodeoxyribonuclease 7 small subunit [candidate division NPL-UPA2 bacterium]MBT9156600.1 Exodeoxyribonuclease 7 small subunit [candidate division NPL-UPA2 bacterium]